MEKEKQYGKIQRNTVLTYDIVILTKMKMIQTSEANLPGSFCWEEKMPRMPNTLCTPPGCPKLVPHGQAYYADHAPLHKHARATSADRGYGPKWCQARTRFLHAHPLCVKCLKEKKLTKATVVDHIIPHRGDSKLFWDENNWQALYKRCHGRKTMTYDRYQGYHYYSK